MPRQTVHSLRSYQLRFLGAHSPQSSSTSGASSNRTGFVRVTSSSTPQSVQRATCPCSGGRSNRTAPSHSGQGEVVIVAVVALMLFLSVRGGYSRLEMKKPRTRVRGLFRLPVQGRRLTSNHPWSIRTPGRLWRLWLSSLWWCESASWSIPPRCSRNWGLQYTSVILRVNFQKVPHSRRSSNRRLRAPRGSRSSRLSQGRSPDDMAWYRKSQA